ncbi:ATP-grasp peptide maturase system methyltransferase [Streptomyces sp. gCLA4]|uniref:ATP-grasp peptide maturase system methyltransferase n=1 Tax=Streptomyces sp. gCLA4 TaxID=1873416 RepID=UPI0015FF3315|nr:ATP-grasp peptide maturase system methyltransferase [Streptomyces sp. gCLA4]
MTDTRRHRRRLAERLKAAGILTDPKLRAAVEATPREEFLTPGIFLPTDSGRWHPVTREASSAAEWAEIAYREESLATQLDGHLTADQTTTTVEGNPTSSSTTPTTVVGMIEQLGLNDGDTVLEIGTGTGYSTALLCHRFGEDQVTTVEVDPAVAARADAALESVGHSTWTVTGDGLLGHPRRAPYNGVICTCAVRRIPHTWIRQTRPGGTVVTTLAPGAWSYGTALAKVTVNDDGTAEGHIVGRSSFMHARAEALPPLTGDLAARAAYADTERDAKLSPALLDEWMPAFLAQLTAPGAQLVKATTAEGQPLLYLFDSARESFAEFVPNASGHTVRQGGPVALWDDLETTLTAWQSEGSPEITTVRLHITDRTHRYWIGGHDALRWEHRLTP